MDSCLECSSYECWTGCRSELLKKPVPFVGLYIAIASLLCCIAIVADIVHGFRHKKLWIPCKYFTINAATLTLLAVAVKLPSDFTTLMETSYDVVTKHGGILLISTSMANFMPSLGSMNGRDILQNMIALSILVTTLFVNIIIQIFTTGVDLPLAVVCATFLISQFVLLSLSATTIGVTKSRLKKEYDERHVKLLNNFVGLEFKEMLQVERLRRYVKYYWVMAETGSPVFVMARSITCSAAAIICVCSIVFGAIVIGLYSGHRFYVGSDYQWSIYLIFCIQSACIVAGTIPPALRTFFTAISFTLKTDINRLRYIFKIEEYWIACLKDWKQRPLDLYVQGHTFRRICQDSKITILNICIVVQIIIVIWSKIILFLSYLCLQPFFFCFRQCGRLRNMILSNFKASENANELELKSLDELSDLTCYVLLLEGEFELPPRILKGICSSLDKVIHMGARQNRGGLMKLLLEKDSFDLKNLMEFDSDEVVSIHLEEPPRCWSLEITSLMCILIALPSVDHNEKRSLKNSVGEGLSYVRLVEKVLDKKKRLENVGKTASVVWNEVELKNKWLDYNLQGKAIKGKNTNEVLQYLAEISEGIVRVFTESKRSKFMENPLNWPENVIAANSLNRISKTMLLHYENIGATEVQPDVVVFKRTVAMISDMFVACLTNLPSVIMDKCYSSTIEKREKSVNEAAKLLGATKDILIFLERYSEVPTLLASDNVVYIDEWRAAIKDHTAKVSTMQSNENPTLITRCASI